MPKRPAKKWMRRCVKKVAKRGSAVDPGAVCGDLWYHKLSPEQKQAALRADEPTAPPPQANPSADADDFEPAIRAYLQATDKGRYVQARPHANGDWHIYYRDHQGKLQRTELKDEEVRAYAAKSGAMAGEGTCSCAHKHPASVPSMPCPVHPTHAAEERAGERVPVLYEPSGKSAREIDVEVLQRAAIKHTEGYWKKKADEAFRAAARNMNLLAKAEARGDFERALKYKAAAAGDEELMEQYLRQAETVRKVKTYGKGAVTGDADFGSDFERIFGRAPSAAETAQARERAENPSPRQATAGIRVPLNVDTRGAHIDGTLKLGGSAAPMLYETASEAPRRRGSKRPKGEEGGGKTVSRWIHWTAVDGSRTYVGRGQITGWVYYVTIVQRAPGTTPNWRLFTSTPGMGRTYRDYEEAMRAADKIEADAGGIPHGAEAREKSITWDRYADFVTPDQRVELRRLAEGLLLRGERLPSNGSVVAGRATFWTYEGRQATADGTWRPHTIHALTSSRSGIASWTVCQQDGKIRGTCESTEAREAPAVTPASSPPLVTLKRNYKQYVECTKNTGIVDGPKGVWKLLGKRMNEEPQEVFVVVPLNIHDRLSDCPVEIARGARSRVEVDPSIVLQAALGANADSFLVIHNHPGDRPDPSPADVELTHTIEKAARAIDTVEFVEHYIVSPKGVFAIRENRMWKP